MSGDNISFGGSVPEYYDNFLGPALFEPFAIDLVSRISSDKTNAVLELACGTGRVTHHLRKHFPAHVKIIATDLNPDMIAVAKRKVPAQGIAWEIADMQELPFPDQTFDLVVCQFGVMFVPDKAKAFREAYRVLTKGGTFLFNTWDNIENNGITSLANQVVSSYFNQPSAFYAIPFSLHQPDVLRSLATDNGFVRATITLVKQNGHSDSPLDAAKGMIQGTPILKEITDRDPSAVKPIVELLRNEISKTFGDGPVVNPLQAWVGEALK